MCPSKLPPSHSWKQSVFVSNFVLFQEKSNSDSEGSHTNDGPVRSEIPDYNSGQHDEMNMMPALHIKDRTAAADKLDICRELEKCHELLRVQYDLNSAYKKEVLAPPPSLTICISRISGK
jgi:hypothetical protein